MTITRPHRAAGPPPEAVFLPPVGVVAEPVLEHTYAPAPPVWFVQGFTDETADALAGLIGENADAGQTLR